RAAASAGSSACSRKPVISAKVPAGHWTLRARIRAPRYSTTAATTGVGLFQWTKPQARLGQTPRGKPPSSKVSRGWRQCGQYRNPAAMADVHREAKPQRSHIATPCARGQAGVAPFARMRASQPGDAVHEANLEF